MTQKTQHYGWTPDLPDHRDLKYAIVRPEALAKPLPPMVDLRVQCPPVYDQGQLGSCTANAIGGAFEFGPSPLIADAVVEVRLPAQLDQVRVRGINAVRQTGREHGISCTQFPRG